MKCLNKIFCLVIGLLFSCNLSSALATPVTLTNGNSSATIDPMTQAGMSNWTVDATNFLAQQWLWFRSAQNTLQQSIENLPLLTQEFLNGSTNTFHIQYGSNSSFLIDVTYELIGGALGSQTATLNENIKITNTSDTNLDFSFFQYSDFDLSSDQDSVEITNDDTATQSSGGMNITEVISTITPATFRKEANIGTNTLNDLNNTSGYQLNLLTAAGPGNVTWAFQWDGILGSSGIFEIMKTKTISGPGTPMPEPSTLFLVGSSLFIAGLARFRRPGK